MPPCSQLRRLVVPPRQLKDDWLELSDQQQHYLRRVLRLQAGDRFVVMDGHGHAWLAQLQQDVTHQASVLEPLQSNTELPIDLTLVAALPKGNGFDDVVRQVTELGVTRIQPVISDRTLLHPGVHKVERWRRIAQESAEQAERLILPTIDAPLTLTQWLQSEQEFDPKTRRYLCVTRQPAPHLLHCLTTTSVAASDIHLAIGPEGGWTEGEIERAIAVGYQPVSLGARIFRAVTAPIAAIALIAACYESQQHSIL
ncbi:MAG: 16S rRNA (uracil(1498)-N(3))-methyltransferase [Leptolyngbyaceae cyanobacterium]